jgi:hypothetical protein
MHAYLAKGVDECTKPGRAIELWWRQHNAEHFYEQHGSNLTIGNPIRN